MSLSKKSQGKIVIRSGKEETDVAMHEEQAKRPNIFKYSTNWQLKFKEKKRLYEKRLQDNGDKNKNISKEEKDTG